jgi:hypothetical protein
MVKLGKVAVIEGNKAKIVYEDINQMTPLIDIASHVAGLQVDKTVVVAIFDVNNLRNGVVIGVIE